MSAWYDNQHITKTTVQSYGEQLETHHLLLPTGLGLSRSHGGSVVPMEGLKCRIFSRWRGEAAERSTFGGFTLRDHLPVSRLIVAYQ